MSEDEGSSGDVGDSSGANRHAADARANYSANIALADDPSSVANAGQGTWWTAVEELRKNHPERY